MTTIISDKVSEENEGDQYCIVCGDKLDLNNSAAIYRYRTCSKECARFESLSRSIDLLAEALGDDDDAESLTQ